MDKEAIEVLLGKGEQVFDTLKELTIQYGPDAVELGLMVVRIDGLATMIQYVILAIATPLVYFYWTRPLWKKWVEIGGWHYTSEGRDMATIFSIFGNMVIGIFGFIGMLQIWTWIQIFYPEVWLAYKAVTKVVE